jgi:NADH-quinone oxidoreductase subunit G
MGRMAAFPPGEAREDWKILRALSGVLGHNLPYDSISQLRKRLVDAAPIFARVDAVTPAEWQGFGRAGSLDPAPFISPVDNYYMTDPISRASVTMAKCTETFILPAREKTGTHG